MKRDGINNKYWEITKRETKIFISTLATFLLIHSGVLINEAVILAYLFIYYFIGSWIVFFIIYEFYEKRIK